jgi:hypothetical protein
VDEAVAEGNDALRAADSIPEAGIQVQSLAQGFSDYLELALHRRLQKGIGLLVLETLA